MIMGKNNDNSLPMIFAVLAVVAVGLYVTGNLGEFAQPMEAQALSFAIDSTTPEGAQKILAGLEKVAVTSNTEYTETVLVRDREVHATDVSTGLAKNQWINGFRYTTYTDAYSPNNLSVMLVTATNYYGAMWDSTDTREELIPPEETGQRLYYLAKHDSSATVSFLNASTIEANASGAKQAIGSGGSEELTMKFDGRTDNAFFGNPELLPASSKHIEDIHPNVICMDGNSTTFDMAKISISGLEKRTSIPMQYTVASTANQTICFDDPSGMVGTADIARSISIPAKSEQNPATNITGEIMDVDYFLHTETGEVGYGIENNVGTDVGLANISFTIYIE